MHPLAFALVSAVLVFTFSGCAQKSVSSAHIYEGNAPTIHFNDEPETAGGRVYAH